MPGPATRSLCCRSPCCSSVPGSGVERPVNNIAEWIDFHKIWLLSGVECIQEYGIMRPPIWLTNREGGMASERPGRRRVGRPPPAGNHKPGTAPGEERVC